MYGILKFLSDLISLWFCVSIVFSVICIFVGVIKIELIFNKTYGQFGIAGWILGLILYISDFMQILLWSGWDVLIQLSKGPND